MSKRGYNNFGDHKLRCVDCGNLYCHEDKVTWMCDEFDCKCSDVLECGEFSTEDGSNNISDEDWALLFDLFVW